jgi:hypothetical protein
MGIDKAVRRDLDAQHALAVESVLHTLSQAVMP